MQPKDEGKLGKSNIENEEMRVGEVAEENNNSLLKALSCEDAANLVGEDDNVEHDESSSALTAQAQRWVQMRLWWSEAEWCDWPKICLFLGVDDVQLWIELVQVDWNSFEKDIIIIIIK